ncbi:MAG: hypothetical protein ABSB15_30275 [Bryobacteraceae bacterium]
MLSGPSNDTKTLNVPAAIEHVMDQNHVVILNRIEDHVIARCEAPQFV